MLTERLLLNAGADWVRIDGGVSAANHQQLVNQFNSNYATRLLLANYKVGAEGLNLQGGNTVVLMDPWYNPAVEDQAIARCHRFGQRRTVSAFCLSMNDTVEERVQHIANQKRISAAEELGDEIPQDRSLTKMQWQCLIFGHAPLRAYNDDDHDNNHDDNEPDIAAADDAAALTPEEAAALAAEEAAREALTLAASTHLQQAEGIHNLHHAIIEAIRVHVDHSAVSAAESRLKAAIQATARQPELDPVQVTYIPLCLGARSRALVYEALSAMITLYARNYTPALLLDNWETLRQVATQASFRRGVNDQLTREILRMFNTVHVPLCHDDQSISVEPQ
jgi:hypothetical protein